MQPNDKYVTVSPKSAIAHFDGVSGKTTTKDAEVNWIYHKYPTRFQFENGEWVEVRNAEVH